jgi:hypothetical protein
LSDTLQKWGIDLRRAPVAVQASLEPIARFFAWHDMHPIAATMVLMERFGKQWLIWEPETLKSEIITVFRATSIAEANWNKIQAVRTLMTSISAWYQWEVFEKVIQALNNNVPDFSIMQRCTVPQLMAGVDMMNQINREDFGSEIDKYVAACAVDQGVTYLPEPLDFAQPALSEHKYRCKDCGNIDDDDLEDGRCDFCVARYQKEHNLDGKPASWIAGDVGMNIERFVKRDHGPAKTRFEDLKNLDTAPDIDEEDAADVQAVKLVVAYKYMRQRRQELVQQTEELKSWVSH